MTTSDDSPLLALSPIVAAQIYEQVAEAVREQIRAGSLKPGDRIPSERDLARTLAVSRPSVREGIASLQLQGLLITRRGAGSYVAPDALERLRDSVGVDLPDTSPLALLEVREHLEPAAARLAARRPQRDPEAESLLDRMEVVLDFEDPSQRQIWSDTDRLFHRQIGLMARNPVLAGICNYIAEVMDQPLWRRLRDESLYSQDQIRAYVREHRHIYTAVVEGDGDAAAFYAGDHVRRVRRHMELDLGATAGRARGVRDSGTA